MKLLFATNNQNKLKEIIGLLSDQFELLTFADIGFEDDIEETGSTIEENASIKSKTIAEKFNINVFSDDSGLEVEALGGAPGVHSARYADKENPSGEKNMAKMLTKMKDEENRNARFKTVISLVLNGKEHLFEGTVNGIITKEKRGESGFGYDPVFQPDGYEITFAQMSAEEKNSISHRYKAVKKLCEFLTTA